MIPQFLNKSQIPHKSGVYIFKNRNQKVIYVGKAIDLYQRVASYFNKGAHLRIQNLVEKIASLETVVVESELEALILEANLIKKNLPSFNVRLTDDKDYLYIGITKETFPKIVTVRKKDLKNVNKFFGPFPSSQTVKKTLKLLRKVFPWCSNPPKKSPKSSKACFYFHLGLCPGPCTGRINQKDYQKIIRRFIAFLDGRKENLVKEIYQDMQKLSAMQQFEQAEILKKVLEGINYLTQPNRVELYLENPNFLEEERRLSLSQLQKDLGLKKIPQRIEGYDISNTGGKEAVGSMVVLTDGEIDKSQYRKFKIKKGGRPDDVGMLREILSRRLRHREWPLPDLIIVDGGRGQVRAVWETMKQFNNLAISFFGLAKRLEWLYPLEGEAIKLPKRSLSLKLLQKLRDESHRFALSYHRKLRDRIK
ncbi:GIY-YIG nuclease family protein [Candidatus Daviesbacteria bacterium]|nr:GIY-YIG nuclease family protein [Candidatus Daviesbacteria bacterium]